MKISKTFRFSKNTIRKLSAVAHALGVNRTRVLERLIREAEKKLGAAK